MFLRLVALDLRLSLRGLLAPLADKTPRMRLALALGLVLALHAAAWPAGRFLGAEGLPAAAARTGALFVLPWAVASPMSALARLLSERGDLDLLLASPVPTRAVFAARLLALALDAISPSALLLLPLADALALQGHPSGLALYPALLGAGLIGASLGAAGALGFAFALGPRRARVVTQVAAALVGGSAALAAQAFLFLPDAPRERLIDALQGAPAAMLGLPARAALGDPAAGGLWLALAVGVYAAAARGLAAPFARAALLAAGATAGAGRSGEPRFTASLRVALGRKERRLLRRDPWLISQMTLQALYTLPIALILWRNGGLTAQPGVAFAPTLVVIAGQLSASLAWIALSAEDAPDFVATAPATRGQIERAKIAAVAGPVALVMAAPLTGLAFAAPGAALAAALCGAGAGLSSAFLMLWRQAPAPRGLVLRRHSQSKVVALLEHWLSLLWAGTTALAALGYAAAIAPLGLIALTLWLARRAA